MKILHTADLHLGATWDVHSRLGDQLRVLDEVLGLCEQHAVDLLLVAGDVFADRAGGKLANVARQFLERLRERLAQGQAVFLLRGNHDELHFFQLLELVMSDLAGGDRWPLVIASHPGVYLLPNGRLQVVALPYMRPSWIEQHAPKLEVSPEARGTSLSATLGLMVEGLGKTADRHIPAIFAGHGLVRGAQFNTEKGVESGYSQEFVLEPQALPRFTSYNALGHIHLAQQVPGTEKPTWYAGGPERMDLGERAYTPRVLLVTTPDQPGGVAEVTELLLESPTAFVYETLNGADAVDNFCRRLGPADPLGIVTLGDIPPDRHYSVQDQIRQATPRVRIEWVRAAMPEVTPGPTAELNVRDIPSTVAAYLAEAYAEQPEQRVRLEERLAALWATAPEEES